MCNVRLSVVAVVAGSLGNVFGQFWGDSKDWDNYCRKLHSLVLCEF